MTTTFTVSGGNGAAPVSVSANDANAGIDPVLIAAIEADVAAGMLVAQDAPPYPFVPMAPVGGYTILRDGGTVNAIGQQAIVAADGAPATITGGGAAAQTVVSGTGGLTFTAASGNTTIAAGGAGNTINLQGGSNVLYTDSSTANESFGGAKDTISATAGAVTIIGSGNQIELGGVSALIRTFGSDTIAASTGTETIGSGVGGLSAQGEVVSGGSSRLTFIAPAYQINDHTLFGGQSTVFGGSGSDTIFGYGVLAGGSAGNNVIDGTGTLLGGGSGDQLFATDPLYNEQDLMAAGAGNETLSSVFEQGSVVLFAGNNVTTAGGATVLANDTMGGGAQAQSQTFFAGTGDAVMIAGPATFTDGYARSDLFAFVNGRAGGTDAIEGFNPNSRVTLQGYGADAVAASLASATVAGGSTAITLPDHTTVLFVGVTDLTAASFV